MLDAAGIDAATTDVYGNSLGFLYFWDLDRPTGDDAWDVPGAPENVVGGNAAIRVGTLGPYFGSGAPLIPTTANIRWITHGRAQGMTLDVNSKQAYRSDGRCSDDPDKYDWQLLRKSTNPSDPQTWRPLALPTRMSQDVW